MWCTTEGIRTLLRGHAWRRPHILLCLTGALLDRERRGGPRRPKGGAKAGAGRPARAGDPSASGDDGARNRKPSGPRSQASRQVGQRQVERAVGGRSDPLGWERRTPTGPPGPRPPRAGAWPPPHRDRRPRPRSSPSRETRGFHSKRVARAAPSSIDHMMQRAWPARRSVRRAWPHPNAQNVRRRCVDGWRSRNVRAVAQAAAASIALSTPICFDPRRNRGRRAKKHNLADVINLNSRFWPFDYVGED